MTDSDIPPPAFKDRKVGLVIFGVLTALMGLGSSLMVPLVMMSVAFAAKSIQPPPVAPNMLPLLALYGGLGVVLIWLGVGSIMTRRWARALLAIWSWSWLVVGLLSIGSLALMTPQFAATLKAARPPGQPPLSDAAQTGALVGMFVLFGFFFVALPMVWGLFYSGKNVKATCEARDPVLRWTDRCPLPVLTVVLWLALGALAMLVMPVFHSAAPFFGLLLTGTAGTAYYLLLAFLWVYCAWALYRLDLRGWWVLVAVIVLYSLSAVITWSRHDLADFYAAMGYSQAQLESLKTFSMNQRTMTWASLIFTVPFLGYLWYIRRFFKGRFEKP